MDLFTHMMISYILAIAFGQATGGISESQLLFGVIAGIFPDLDILTFPAWRWVPFLRHHGITHTLVFPIANAFVMSVIVYAVWGLDPLLFIPIGLLTGVFHVISDLLTNYPVPLLYPFKRKDYSLMIDSAVNPYLMFPVLVLIIYFWQLRSTAFPLDTFLLMLGLVAALLTAHFSVKLGLKLHIKRKYRGEGQRVDANPTMRYLVWHVVPIERFGRADVLEYIKIRLGRPERIPLFFEVEGPQNRLEPPMDTRHKAVLQSYSCLSRDQLKALSRKGYYAAQVIEEPKGGKGAWKVFWFSWWDSFRKGKKGLMVEVGQDGECKAEEFCATEGLSQSSLM